MVDDNLGWLQLAKLGYFSGKENIINVVDLFRYLGARIPFDGNIFTEETKRKDADTCTSAS